MSLRVSRDWATPLTIGVFAMMAITGGLMFFHADVGLQKLLHEWLGWLMVAAVGVHVLANAGGFLRYFRTGPVGLATVAVSVAALAASFVVRGADEGPSPPVLAIAALTQAPIAQVAPLFGKTAGQARDELARQGIVLDGDDKTIAQAVGRDRGKTAAALRTLAQRP